MRFLDKKMLMLFVVISDK